MEQICDWTGISRQAHYRYRKRKSIQRNEEKSILKQVCRIRQRHPRMGTQKLLTKLKSTKKGYKPGRDRLFSLLRKHQLLIPLKKRRYARTTQAGWWRCENRLTDFTPDAPDQADVSDITYLDSAHGFVYLTLIIDAFSRYIVGYVLSDSLATDALLKVLEQALSQRETPKSGLIHHSDRGVQFTDHRYRQRLARASAVCSMGAKGNCYDNVMAERMNGILKQEYGLDAYFRTIQQAEEAVRQSVWLYNNERPHLSLNYRTPAEIHQII